ncbi:DUF1799 domain-containing protein [Massilia oculi]|uniref:DUF1799 domain-containing protein n=1 Tax=Massilia hydrophila TaxID=3044279 RepID=A0ABS7YCM1_9BURK|nr:DUF1799 domain-containing protein [Massilia oculi]MCA1857456.1 DUF1799 domain-containing protein [Massilia oculi]
MSEKQMGELLAAGFSPDDVEAGEPVEIWPENLPAYDAFCGMSTQWRVGMSGATGLDYNALPVVLRLQGAPRADWQQLFVDIRVMEQQALLSMRAE